MMRRHVIFTKLDQGGPVCRPGKQILLLEWRLHSRKESVCEGVEMSGVLENCYSVAVYSLPSASGI